MNIATIWYGPHACEVCGVVIVKAAREHGGAEFNYPVGLTIYPNHAWAPHVHLKPRGWRLDVSTETVARVRQMQGDGGLSLRGIARQCGLSYSAVRGILGLNDAP